MKRGERPHTRCTRTFQVDAKPKLGPRQLHALCRDLNRLLETRDIDEVTIKFHVEYPTEQARRFWAGERKRLRRTTREAGRR